MPEERRRGLGGDSLLARLTVAVSLLKLFSMKRVTLKNVAAKAGVATSTVSLALNGNHQIPEKTRKRIEAVAEELGYVKHPFLSILGRRRSRGAGVEGLVPVALLTQRLDVVYREALVEEGKRMGLGVEIFPAAEFLGKAGSRILYARGVAGIFVGAGCHELDFGDFDWSRFVALRLDSEADLGGGARLETLSFEPMFDLFRLLSERGYRRIGCLLDTHDPMIGDDHRRIGAFYAAQRLEPESRRVPPLLRGFGDIAEDGEVAAYLEREAPDAVIVMQPAEARRLNEWQGGAGYPTAALVVSRLEERWCSGWLMPDAVKMRIAVQQMSQLIQAGAVGIDQVEVVYGAAPEWNEGTTLG